VVDSDWCSARTAPGDHCYHIVEDFLVSLARMQRRLRCSMLAGLLLAVVFASGSSANPATCSLTLTGSRSGNTSTISAASMQCTGGIVSASADQTLLSSFTKSDKIGVNMTDRECKQQQCLHCAQTAV
jgi:hypothetical protein